MSNAFSLAEVAHTEMDLSIQINHKNYRPSSVLDTIEQFLTELFPFDLEKIPIICSSCSFSLQRFKFKL